MKSIRFCLYCGGLLEVKFLFCPYCGAELAAKPSFLQIIDPSFKKLNSVAADFSLRRLDSYETALNSLEKELDDFLLKRL